MGPNSQVLWYDGAAPAALLCCSSRVNPYYLRPGTLSLGLEDSHEAVPSSVGDMTGQPAAPQHATHVEAFHSDEPVTVNEVSRGLVMEVLTAVSHLLVNPLDAHNRLLATVGPPLLPGQRPLGSAKGLERAVQKAGVVHSLTIRRGEETLEPDIQADRWITTTRNPYVPKVARQDGIPLAGLALDGDGLYLTRPFAVKPHLHFTDSEQVKHAAHYSTPLIQSERERVEVVAAPEPRESSTAEEVAIGLVESSEGEHSAIGPDALIPGVDSPGPGKPSGLVEMPDTHPPILPRLNADLKRVVVEPSVRLKRRLQLAALIGIGIEAVLIGPSHGGKIE